MIARRGFTVIEMMVAIVVAAGVIATARSMIGAVGDAGARIASAAADEDILIGGEQFARSLVRRARLPAGDSLPLIGTDRGFVVSSWCPVPGGWREPCDAAFAVDDSTSSLVFRAGRGPQPLIAIRSHGVVRLRYLASVTDGGRWVDRWSEPDLPFAVGVIAGADTLIMPAGR